MDSDIHHGKLDQDEQYWSSEDEQVDEDTHSEVPSGDGLMYQVGEENTGVGEEAEPKAPGRDRLPHRLYNTKYGSKQLVPMEAILAKGIVPMSQGKGLRIKALADSGSSASIISLELTIKLGLEREDPGDTELQDASGSRMDVSAVATMAVREMTGIPSCFQVLVSKDIGKDDVVIGIDELKTLHILHQDFPRTLPEFRRAYSGNHVCLHMPVVKDEEVECEKERASGGLL